MSSVWFAAKTLGINSDRAADSFSLAVEAEERMAMARINRYASITWS
jgi:hypothetical protein